MKRWVLVLLFSAMGCVSSGRYDAAVAELNTCKADGENQKHAYSALEQGKAQSDAKLHELMAQLEDLGKQSAQLQTEKGTLTAGMTNLQAQLAELRQKEEAERQRAAMFEGLKAKLKGMMEAGKLTVYTRKGRMLVKLPDNVLFDPGKIEIKAAGKDAIEQLTAALASIPDRKFQVAGYTDNTPMHTGRFPSNWELSAGRAVEVVKLMIKSGMPPERVSAAGFADDDPVAGNDTADGKAQNRRIEVELMPNLDELPKLDDSSPQAAVK